MRTEAVLREVELAAETGFGELPLERLEAMAEAGAEILDIHRILTKTGDNVVGEVLRNHGTFYEWDHFPPGDVFDHETNGQYYYHAHPKEQRFDSEHGHFHTFLRPNGMPPGILPAEVPGAVIPKGSNDALSHLVAIAMDAGGIPFRLFTVNRWVTGETWYSAPDVCAMLDRFRIDHARPSWPANRWITALIQLYRPQIETLLALRDRTVESWQRAHPEGDVYEDRDLEITSFVDISVESQVRAVGQALLDRA